MLRFVFLFLNQFVFELTFIHMKRDSDNPTFD